MKMNSIFAAAVFTLPMVGAAGAFDHSQDKSKIDSESSKLIEMMSAAGASSIECSYKEVSRNRAGEHVLKITPAVRPAPGNHLLYVEGSTVYGYEDVREFNLASNLIMTYGEEGNMTLIIRNFGNRLFDIGYPNTQPQFDAARTVPAVLVDEDDKIDELECKAVRN